MHCCGNGRLSEQADADRRFGCCARAAPRNRPNPVHEEVDCDPIQSAGENRTSRQEYESAAYAIKCAGGREGDHEMQYRSEQCGLPTTVKGFRTKQPTSDTTQNLGRPDSPRRPRYKGSRDIQNTGCYASREDGKKCAGFLRRCLR